MATTALSARAVGRALIASQTALPVRAVRARGVLAATPHTSLTNSSCGQSRSATAESRPSRGPAYRTTRSTTRVPDRYSSAPPSVTLSPHVDHLCPRPLPVRAISAAPLRRSPATLSTLRRNQDPALGHLLGSPSLSLRCLPPNVQRFHEHTAGAPQTHRPLAGLLLVHAPEPLSPADGVPSGARQAHRVPLAASDPAGRPRIRRRPTRASCRVRRNLVPLLRERAGPAVRARAWRSSWTFHPGAGTSLGVRRPGCTRSDSECSGRFPAAHGDGS